MDLSGPSIDVKLKERKKDKLIHSFKKVLLMLGDGTMAIGRGQQLPWPLRPCASNSDYSNNVSPCGRALGYLTITLGVTSLP